jgi:hypothetical protein
MRTHNGSIRTNFSAGVLQTKTEKSSKSGDARAPEARSEAESEARSRSEVQREIDREMARVDREQARIARDVAKEVAKATAEATRAAASVRVNVNGDDVVVAAHPPAPAHAQLRRQVHRRHAQRRRHRHQTHLDERHHHPPGNEVIAIGFQPGLTAGPIRDRP